MRCDEVEELSDAYAIGALDPAEREAVERHLESCQTCHDLLERATLAAASLALAAPLVKAPPDLRARIVHQLAQEEQLPRGATPIRQLLSAGRDGSAGRALAQFGARGSGFRLKARWLQPLAASIAVLALVGCAVWIARLQNQVNRMQARSQTIQRAMSDSEGLRAALMLLASEGTVRFEMKPSDPAAGVAGAVIWNPDRHKCSILVSGLPDAPPEQSYHVWLVGYQRSWDGGELTASGNGAAEKTMDLDPMASQSGYQVVVSLQQRRASGGAWQPVLKAWVGIQ